MKEKTHHICFQVLNTSTCTSQNLFYLIITWSIEDTILESYTCFIWLAKLFDWYAQLTNYQNYFFCAIVIILAA